MEFGTILGALAGLVLVGLLVFGAARLAGRRRLERVRRGSARYRALLALNARQRFRAVDGLLRDAVSCSSKAEFDRFRPEQYLAQYVRENEGYVRGLMGIAAQNQALYARYRKELEGLPPCSFSSGRTADLEKSLVEEAMLKPVVALELEVSVTYVSPAGRNQYCNEFRFDKDELRAAMRELQQLHTEAEARRREREKVTPSLRYDVMARDGFRCVICGATAQSGAKLHVDHIVPVSRGGKTEMDNLQTLCERCNLGKGNKMPQA